MPSADDFLGLNAPSPLHLPRQLPDGNEEDRACDEEQAAEDEEEEIGQDFLEILTMSADV